LSKITLPQFSKPDGLNETADDETTDILKKHFQAVFKRKYVTTDETLVDKIEELEIDEYLKEELRSIQEIEQVKKAISKIKRETAPGVTGLTSDMLKAFPEKALEHLTLLIQKF
jgi:hypothetical protein